MTTYVLCFVITVLAAIIYLQYRKIAELVDRLMSRDFQTYMAVKMREREQAKPAKKDEKAHISTHAIPQKTRFDSILGEVPVGGDD